jgi:hypothetical protein
VFLKQQKGLESANGWGKYLEAVKDWDQCWEEVAEHWHNDSFLERMDLFHDILLMLLL